MPKKSAGILVYRIEKYLFEVLLVHPGGPFWKNKDNGSWSIPKGEYQDDEDPLKAAIREFKEELGLTITGDFMPLSAVKQKGGKQVAAFAVNSNPDISNITSNTVSINWPPKSGKQIMVPEIDKAEWFDIVEASEKINTSQVPLIDELLSKIFMLNEQQVMMIRLLGNIIKQKKLVEFYYESNAGKPNEHKDWRRIEPYMIAIHNEGAKKGKMYFTGYFLPDSKQRKEGRLEEQKQYYIDKVDTTQFKILDETFEKPKITYEKIYDTPTVTVFYRTDFK